jgi:hypothetical protein
MNLHLTDLQARILAVCGLCSRPLAWKAVKPALESGDIHPHHIYCARCGIRACAGVSFSEALGAAMLMLARIEAAGLTEHYERVAADAGYPPWRPA